MRRVVSVLFVGGVAAFGASEGSAQEDFRSLDLSRPIRVVDAYPKKYLEWEIQLGARGELSESRRGVEGMLELETGLLRNLEVGIELEPGWEDEDGEGSTAGLRGLGMEALYNFNQESWRWPGLALQLEAEAPVGGGGLAREEWGFGGRLVATRSFASRLRIHANAGYFAADESDGDDFWLTGVAVDFPVGLFSRLVLGGLYAEVPVESGTARVWLELGTRLQLTNLSVLDLGVATRLDGGDGDGPTVELVVGLSRIFGIPGLAPDPDYPEPALR